MNRTLLPRAAVAASTWLWWVGACSSEVEVGAQLERSAIRSDGGPDAIIKPCQVTECRGAIFACGNCEDDDGDGLVDMQDPDCLGPCHNAEDTFYISIPGQNKNTCLQECYFDPNPGLGDDVCRWSYTCDPRSADADLAPLRDGCAYEPDRVVTGRGPPTSCSALSEEQPEACRNGCLPIVPNGCDCFGCCQFPDLPHAVWLGSQDEAGRPTCEREHLTDPVMCRPCTQVPSCLNGCERCELCVGKTELPPDCSGGAGDSAANPVPECDTGTEACGLSGLADCEIGYTCVTGCCIRPPR